MVKLAVWLLVAIVGFLVLHLAWRITGTSSFSFLGPAIGGGLAGWLFGGRAYRRLSAWREGR